MLRCLLTPGVRRVVARSARQSWRAGLVVEPRAVCSLRRGLSTAGADNKDTAAKKEQAAPPAQARDAPPAARGSAEVIEDSVKLKVPDEGHKESTLVSWAVEEGAKVEINQPLCEIDTTDFSYDYNSPEAGFLVKITKEKGAKLSPGDIIGYMVLSEHEVAEWKHAFADKAKSEAKAAPSDARAEPLKTKAAIGTSAAPDAANGNPVTLFLSSLESDMSSYSAKFIEDGFDSLAAIETLKSEDLESMGVKKGHIRVIMHGVSDLIKTK